jgi:hypothetical protein
MDEDKKVGIGSAVYGIIIALVLDDIKELDDSEREAFMIGIAKIVELYGYDIDKNELSKLNKIARDILDGLSVSIWRYRGYEESMQ